MLSRLLGVLSLRARTYREIADDRSATGQAAVLVIVVALIAGIGGAVVLGNFGNLIPLPVPTGGPIRYAVTTILYTILGWLFTSWVFAYVSRIILKSKTTTLQMARVFGYIQVFAFLQLIPCIGNVLAFILSLIGAIIGIREASRFDTRKALITAIAGFIVYAIIVALVNWVGSMIIPG